MQAIYNLLKLTPPPHPLHENRNVGNMEFSYIMYPPPLPIPGNKIFKFSDISLD